MPSTQFAVCELGLTRLKGHLPIFLCSQPALRWALYLCQVFFLSDSILRSCPPNTCEAKVILTKGRPHYTTGELGRCYITVFEARFVRPWFSTWDVASLLMQTIECGTRQTNVGQNIIRKLQCEQKIIRLASAVERNSHDFHSITLLQPCATWWWLKWVSTIRWLVGAAALALWNAQIFHYSLCIHVCQIIVTHIKAVREWVDVTRLEILYWTNDAEHVSKSAHLNRQCPICIIHRSCTMNTFRAFWAVSKVLKSNSFICLHPWWQEAESGLL